VERSIHADRVRPRVSPSHRSPCGRRGSGVRQLGRRRWPPGPSAAPWRLASSISGASGSPARSASGRRRGAPRAVQRLARPTMPSVRCWSALPRTFSRMVSELEERPGAGHVCGAHPRGRAHRSRNGTASACRSERMSTSPRIQSALARSARRGPSTLSRILATRSWRARPAGQASPRGAPRRAGVARVQGPAPRAAGAGQVGSGPGRRSRALAASMKRSKAGPYRSRFRNSVTKRRSRSS